MNAWFLRALPLVAVVVAGCAGFRADTLGPIAWPPTGPSKPPSIRVVVSGKVETNGRRKQASSKSLEIWRRITREVYRDSSLFSVVGTGAGETDLRAEVRFFGRVSVNRALSALSALMLFVIPSKSSEEVRVETTFYDREGTQIAVIEKTEMVTMWQHLFMLFVMPVQSPQSEARAAIGDVNRATLLEAQARGILDARPLVPPL